MEEQLFFEDEHMIKELEAEIECLREMIHGILEKKGKKSYRKKFMMEQLRWVRVYNSFRRRLLEKESELEELELRFYGAKIEAELLRLWTLNQKVIWKWY